MINDYPESLVALQVHTAYYTTAWGTARKSFFSVGGIPDTYFDAVLQCLGAYQNDDQMYNWYNSKRVARLAVPTDVTIEIYGEPMGKGEGKDSLPTYLITVYLGVEEGGEAKTVRLHIIDALFDYPYNTDGRYNNCVRNGYTHNDIDLVPGETVEITQEITFRAESEANPDNIRIIAFAEEPVTHKPGNVYQSEMATWPLTPPPSCPEDVNADEMVDIDDLFDILAHWGETGGTYDVNDDGMVDIDDVFAVLAAWGPC
ncbi:MAG: hypothetical protein JSV91_16150 [Phycisphaerales bacterium]|nr:MAG: hypothetical protein JSV91_16150 [Phycisphaerales bacterium]